MSKPTILTLAYLGVAILWQYILWTLWPNVGMGGLAIVYIVWPLLGLSGVTLWFLFKRFRDQRMAILAVVSTAMIAETYLMHPSV